MTHQLDEPDAVLSLRNLRVELGDGRDVVAGIGMDIRAGEIVGLVGESGSGKTTVGMALLGFARRGAAIVSGSVTIAPRPDSPERVDILALPEKRRRPLRGSAVAYIPQDPAASLNPALRIERQLREVVEAHERRPGRDTTAARTRAALKEVGLDADSTLPKYPHQLSGGQQQRVCIAMALIMRPRVLVLDEPTTGLDVSTQANILKLLRDVCTAHEIAALYVTHDLSVLASIADRVVVMYAGRIVEDGSRTDVFDRARHPYSQGLLGSVPDVRRRTELAVIPGDPAPPGHRPAGCAFHPRCPVAMDVCREEDPPSRTAAGHMARCHHEKALERVPRPAVDEPDVVPDRNPVLSVRNLSASYGHTPVLHDVTFDLLESECLAVVGESGSGKTTLARCLIGLHGAQHGGHKRGHGAITYRDALLAPTAQRRTASQRQRLQYIFQSPFNSLNPRKSVMETLLTAYRTFYERDRAAERSAVAEALEAVGLSARAGALMPDELSGGERQRVSIARALISRPDVLLCDEVTSALDVSVQAAILRLLRRLKDERGLSMIFVTHDLAVVRNIADRVLVLDSGRIVEADSADSILDRPQHDYTRKLVADTPSIEAAPDRSAGRPTPSRRDGA